MDGTGCIEEIPFAKSGRAPHLEDRGDNRHLSDSKEEPRFFDGTGSLDFLWIGGV